MSAVSPRYPASLSQEESTPREPEAQGFGGDDPGGGGVGVLVGAGEPLSLR
jgi:hypothetical protein